MLLRRCYHTDACILCIFTSCCSSETLRVMPADVIVLEGILVLHMGEVRQLMNMKV